jgi:tetratricopeptide (TPR) repeat protein
MIAGRFEVLRELGRGGMGTVYEVRDPSTGDKLALKRLKSGPRDADAHQRFRREFTTLAHLAHPRVVAVHEYGETGGRPFYTMELLDGQDLRELSGAPIEHACGLARDVAAALAFLHARRLLHRDLSPRNVRCTSNGRAKLIDFGVLATIGSARDVAGTPPFMAPENLRGLPLDPRADMFGIGALLYWLLTGRHAFPAHTLAELEGFWQNRPPPPSSIARGVPAALDELVLSLLRIDPLGRPATAAEVIDRLGAIAGLPPLADAELARGYIASTTLVGRRDEMAQLRKLLESAQRGRGRAVVLDGPSGAGKSRILRELRLEAQLAGATVVEIDATTAGSGPLAGLRQLVRELLLVAPEATLAAAKPRAGLLARALPELRVRLGKLSPEPRAGDPAEDRMRLTAALAELVGAVAQVAIAPPLIVLVDDVQRIDELSAAVLAALAQAAADRTLLVCAAVRSDEPARAPEALAALVEAAARLTVAGLDAADVVELVRRLLGPLPEGELVARKVYATAGGQPLHLIEALGALVDGGALNYTDGTWTVHGERLERFAFPRELAGALAARVARLSPTARALAEALAVRGGELSFALVEALCDGDATELVGELVAADVLVGASDRYRFRHDGVRDALVAGLAAERERALHAAVARALEATGAAADDDLASALGWHLVRGGDRLRGARLLDRAGERHFEQCSFRDAIPLLECALEVYREHGVEPARGLDLRHMLLAAGCMADRAVVLRWADESLEAFRRQAGMDTAERIARVLGMKLGVLAGVVWAGLRWLVARPGRRGPGPLAALRQFFMVYGYAITGYAVSFELPQVRAMRRYAEPLRAFEGRIPYAAYLVVDAMLAFETGRFERVRAHCQEALRILERDRLTRVSDIDRKNIQGPALYLLAMLASLEEGTQADELLAALDALDLHFYRTAALVARITRHRYRGEESDARRLEARLARYRVQLGSVWQMDAQLALVSAVGYGWTGDVAGLRRMVGVLEQMVEAGYRIDAMLELARGEYHRDRGDPKRGAEVLRGALALVPDDVPALRICILASLADTLHAAGDHEGAAAAARAALAEHADPDIGHDVMEARVELALARADVERGDTAAALARLDRIETGVAAKNPVARGASAEIRARIALAANEPGQLEQHLHEMARWLRRTRNPVLVARAEAIADRARRPRPRVGAEPVDQITTVETAVTVAAKLRAFGGLAMLSGVRDRCQRALELVVEATGATAAQLVLVRDDAPVTAAALGDPPDAALADAIDRAIAGWVRRGATETDGDGERLADWRVVPLCAALPARDIVVGAIALRAAASPDGLVLAQLARELYHAGDASGLLVEPASSSARPSPTPASAR